MLLLPHQNIDSHGPSPSVLLLGFLLSAKSDLFDVKLNPFVALEHFLALAQGQVNSEIQVRVELVLDALDRVSSVKDVVGQIPRLNLLVDLEL